MQIEYILLWVAALIFASVVSSKLSDKFAIPALLLFLAIGMFAGSEGVGGIYFDNAQLAKSIGVVALMFIIFSGGLDTNYQFHSEKSRDLKTIFAERSEEKPSGRHKPLFCFVEIFFIDYSYLTKSRGFIFKAFAI